MFVQTRVHVVSLGSALLSATHFLRSDIASERMRNFKLERGKPSDSREELVAYQLFFNPEPLGLNIREAREHTGTVSFLRYLQLVHIILDTLSSEQ